MSLIKANLTHHLRRHNGLKWGSGPRPACTKSQLPSRETWQSGAELSSRPPPPPSDIPGGSRGLATVGLGAGHTSTIALTLLWQVTLQTEEVRNNRSQVDINMVKYLLDIYRCCISTIQYVLCVCAVVLSVLLLHSAGKLYDLLVRGNAAWAWAGEGGITRPSFTRHPQTMPHNQCLHFWHQYSQ